MSATKHCDLCDSAFGEEWPWIRLTRPRSGTGRSWNATVCSPKCVSTFMEDEYALASTRLTRKAIQGP